MTTPKVNHLDREKVDIIIPTMDNINQLISAVSSMLSTREKWPIHIIIVNNGKDQLEQFFHTEGVKKHITILNPGKNLGWTGGLAHGLEHSKAKFVMFANDDIFVPVSSIMWMSQLVSQLIIWPKIGAVGPATNLAMGSQNMFQMPMFVACTPTFLIGFCMLTRRSTLDEIGGIDENFATGDDIELSIRFIQHGYTLMTNKSVFVYHHGFQTGERLYGGPDKPRGWNSKEMTDSTNRQIIQKHGFKSFWNTMCRSISNGWLKDKEERFTDHNYGKGCETNVVLSSINGSSPSDILEIGCGGTRTVAGSVTLDKEKAGTPISFTGKNSVADLVGDAQLPLPIGDKKFKVIIARHVLEHCIDVIGALESWKDALHDDGVLIISVPDESIANTIFLNSEHVHAFTPDSLNKIVDNVGMKVTKTSERYSADSFTLEIRKERVAA